MADIKSSEERSKNMSAIKNRDTQPEIYFRKLLFANGYRYRKNVSYIPGHPDLYLAKYNTAIFVHGCFWHRHEGCKYAYTPKSRIEFWNRKFNDNIKRDITVQEQLKASGIKCFVIWECTINKTEKSSDAEKNLLFLFNQFINGDTMFASY